jgi:hypothetical protein
MVQGELHSLKLKPSSDRLGYEFDMSCTNDLAYRSVNYEEKRFYQGILTKGEGLVQLTSSLR